MRNAASFIASQSISSEAGILLTVLRRAQDMFGAWKSRRQVSNLTDLDDHLLDDIGLTRGDVREALELPFSYDPGRELQVRVSRHRTRGWNT